MIAVDTNILVYASREDSQFHPAAVARVTGLAEGLGAWAIPWQCIHEFYGVVTNRRLYPVPTPRDVALDQISTWLASPRLVLLRETAEHWDLLRGLIEAGQITGPMVHDARIAALCLGHGVRELWSADRDFNRFPRLTVRNPLVG